MSDKKKVVTKQDKIRIAKQIAQMKNLANQLQADLEQFAATYEEPNRTGPENKKMIEEVYGMCDQVIISWGRYSRDVDY